MPSPGWADLILFYSSSSFLFTVSYGCAEHRYGTYSVAEALNAGLDLEMPGPPRWRELNLVNHMISSRKLLPDTITTRAETVVKFVQNLTKMSPEVVYGDGKERTRDTPEIRAFGRRVAAEGMVLLRNEDELLPLTSSSSSSSGGAGGQRRIAVIGPNAKGRVISGGGSAYLKATYIVSPWEGLLAAAPKNVKLEYSVGCYGSFAPYPHTSVLSDRNTLQLLAHKYLPTLEDQLVTHDGRRGWLCVFYAHDENGSGKLTEVARYVLQDTRIKLNDFLPEGLGSEWTIKLTGKLTHDETRPFELGLTVAGRAKLYINGKMTIDNWTKQRPGDFFYGQGTVEEKATIEMAAGKSVDVMVEYTNTPPPDAPERDLSQPALMLGVVSRAPFF